MSNGASDQMSPNQYDNRYCQWLEKIKITRSDSMDEKCDLKSINEERLA